MCLRRSSGWCSLSRHSIELPKLGVEEVLAVFRKHVPNLEAMRDWSGECSIIPFLTKTYEGGLPRLRQESPALNTHLINAFRTIVHQAHAEVPLAIKSMKALAEAFEVCV